CSTTARSSPRARRARSCRRRPWSRPLWGRPMADAARLVAEGLQAAYGDATALWDVTLEVGEGELVAVVGPNGAGKTTLVNALARLLPIRAGRLSFGGADMTRLSPQETCRLGVAIIPEGRRLFASMTVEENLELGCYRRAARRHRDEGL